MLRAVFRIRDPDSVSSVDPDPDPGGNMTHKNRRKKIEISCFCSAGYSLLRAEGFFCSLDVLYGGLGIGKLQFCIKRRRNFSLVNFINFWS